jgi:tetratricopeptide (TPR) repeat protein
MAKSGAEYGRPLIERIAPDGVWNRRAVFRAAPLVLFVLLLLYSLVKALHSGKSTSIFFFFSLLCLFFIFVAFMTNNRAANVFARVLWPQGNASPYQRDFSFEKSLVMQNRIGEALQAYEEQIRARPSDAEAYVQAAELNAARGSVSRAVELFRSVRLLPHLADSYRVYATNRLIDLYIGSGEAANPQKARSELHYMIVHFPHTQAASRAKEVLQRL